MKVLLKVVSILFIIAGALSIIAAIVGIAAGSCVASLGVEGAGGVGALIIIITIILCIQGILEFIAGIKGVSKHNGSFGLGIAILVLAVASIVMSIVSGSNDVWSIVVSAIGGIALPVLYLIAVKGSK